MLQDGEFYAFVPAPNVGALRPFYTDVLGLEVVDEGRGRVVLDAPGVPLVLVEAPNVVPQPYTVVGWNVHDLTRVAGELSNRGVEMLRYDNMDQDDLGVWTAPDGTRLVWFEDPAGNTLSISQSP